MHDPWHPADSKAAAPSPDLRPSILAGSFVRVRCDDSYRLDRVASTQLTADGRIAVRLQVGNGLDMLRQHSAPRHAAPLGRMLIARMQAVHGCCRAGFGNLWSLSAARLPTNVGMPSQHPITCACPALAQVTGRCVPLASLSRGSPLEDAAAGEQQGQQELAALQGALAEQPPTCWEVRGARTVCVPPGSSARCAGVASERLLCGPAPNCIVACCCALTVPTHPAMAPGRLRRPAAGSAQRGSGRSSHLSLPPRCSAGCPPWQASLKTQQQCRLCSAVWSLPLHQCQLSRQPRRRLSSFWRPWPRSLWPLP